MELDNTAQFEQVAIIKVIGVGGAGNNAVNRMIEAGVPGVEFFVANTDAQVLSTSKAKQRIILGKELSKGLGAGANPAIGEQAAIESESEIKKVLEGADMVFIAAGMGGGTGTGAAHVIAKIAKKLGALTIAIITKPFTFEGRQRTAFAGMGIEKLRKQVDAIIIISNDKLLQVVGTIPVKDSFREADNVLRQGVQTITDLIAVPALINLDFADVRTILQNKGSAFFGIGMGQGENKAEESANKAINSPLVENVKIKGAKNLILNVTGGTTMTLIDVNHAVNVVRNEAGTDVNIIFGVAINENLEDGMIVTVIATGFEESRRLSAINNFGTNKVNVLDFINANNTTLATSTINNFQEEQNNLTSDISESLHENDDLPAFLRRRKT